MAFADFAAISSPDKPRSHMRSVAGSASTRKRSAVRVSRHRLPRCGREGRRLGDGYGFPAPLDVSGQRGFLHRDHLHRHAGAARSPV